VPGCVNLIGECINYTPLGVLLATIEHNILVVCAPHEITTVSTEIQHQPGSIIIENLDPKYRQHVFAPAFTSSLQTSGGAWDLDII